MIKQDKIAVEEQLDREIEKLGQREFRDELQCSARIALSDFPTDSELEELSPAGRQIIQRMCSLAERCSQLDNFRDPESLAVLAIELGWAKQIMDVAVAFLQAPPRGDGPSDGEDGEMCATKCKNEYNQCINEHNCDESAWVCICCSPCSLQYMGCMADCVVTGSGGGLFDRAIA